MSPEHDAEVRRVSITNLGTRTRDIELTSYAEIVLAPPAADIAHPVFSNLFVQTEWAPELGALLATRRPRSHGEPQVWMAHVVVTAGNTIGAVQYETDRARFLGRGRGIRTPLAVIDGHPLSNTVGAVLTRNTQGPSALWGHGISGDLPIVLVRIDAAEDQAIIRQLLRAHEYWRLKQLAVDLVILNEQTSSYAQQDLQTALEAQVQTSQSRVRHEGHEAYGSVFMLRADRMSAADRALLQTAARAVLVSRGRTLAEQIGRRQRSQTVAVPLPPRPTTQPVDVVPSPWPDLEFFNGLGGFAADGREYVTILGQGQWTPAPWINVIANPVFGFQVSESGAGYTWSLNSRENQLTPWSNDPVSDPPGETMYIRDEESGELWGPTVLPIREEAWPYMARHGQGYSRFEHTSHGIALDLLQFVPLQDPIKIARLTLTNHSGRPRRLAVTAYVEWVLGRSRSAAAPFVVTEIDTATGAMLAHNAWNSEFAGRRAFADLGGRQTAWTGDRTEFLGRNGTPDHPAALAQGDRLSGKVGAGLDPCGALQTTVELRTGSRAEVVVLLGEAATMAEARALSHATVRLTLMRPCTRWWSTGSTCLARCR